MLPATCLGLACRELCFLAVNLGDTAADNARRGQMSTQSCIAIRQKSSHSVLRKLSSVRSFIAPHFCPPAFRCLKSGRWRARKTTCSSTSKAGQGIGAGAWREERCADARPGNAEVRSNIFFCRPRKLKASKSISPELQAIGCARRRSRLGRAQTAGPEPCVTALRMTAIDAVDGSSTGT